MLEYEINPAGAFPLIYWPDISKFTSAHVERFTLGNKEAFAELAIFGLLCDLPHEVGEAFLLFLKHPLVHVIKVVDISSPMISNRCVTVHLLQGCCNQVIQSGDDAGWLAEHDPSIASFNILAHALGQPNTDDEFTIPGLLETVRLWSAERVIQLHTSDHVTAAHVEGYHRWRASCGYESPDVDFASIAADYVKLRAAVEAFPIDPAMQLDALFNGRTGDIRSQPRPPLVAFRATDERSVFHWLDQQETKSTVES